MLLFEVKPLEINPKKKFRGGVKGSCFRPVII